jgi:RHS repeat-associated protein
VSSTSPVVATTYYLGSSPESETSNSFSPPAESVVVVTVFADDSYNAAGWTSESMTDSLSTHLSWHLVKFQGDTSSTGAVGVWWAYVASTPGSMTVTPTLAVGSGQYIDSMGVAVKVFTGANTTAPIGATASGDYSGQDLSVLLTPTTTGSALLLAGTDGHFTGAPSAGSGDYVSDVMNNNNTSAAQEWAGTSSGPTLTASTSSQTLALIGGSSSAQFDYLAFEVVPAGTGTSHPGLPVTTTDPDGVVTTDTYNGAGQVTKSAVSSGSYSATTVTGYDPAGNAYCTIAALAYSQGDTTCPLVSALASGSAGLSLPQSTIYVTSTTGFSVSSPIAVPSNAGLQVVTCTGTTSTPSTGFTGCTGGTGALAAGSSVVQVTSTAAGTDYWPGDKITIADANNRTLFAVSPIGGVTQELYDGTGSEYCSVSAQAYSNGVRCPSTEPTTPPTATSDPYLGGTITSYNAAGQVSQVTNPLGGITLSTYDGDGNLSTQTVESSSSSGAPSVQTNYYYDADDQVTEKVVGYGSSSPLTTLDFYDPDANIYCSVSAKAYAAGGYACPSWQASWATSTPPVSTLYTTDGAALVTTSIYDADGELVQQSNPDEATTISVYNAGGSVVCAEDAADMAVTLAANPNASYPYTCPATPRTSPPANGSDPGYETSIYDPYGSGRLTSSTDAAGDTTSYTYDPDGSVLVETGPGGQLTTNCYYWQTSSCASGAPAGGGAANALYSTISPPAVGEPSGTLTTYTYLPGGPAHTTTTLAGTATDAYDAAGDLLSLTYGTPATGYAAAPNVTYTYFASGLRHTMVDGTGTTTYSYDNNNDPLSSAFSPGNGTGLSSGTTSYGYYTTGQEQTLTYPSTPSGGSPTVTRTYNADGELASTTDWAGDVINFTDDPDGNTTGVAYPNSTEVSSTYDYGDAETSVTAATGTPASPGTTLVGANYTLNSAEQVTNETDAGAISTTRVYGYDSADRLGTATLGSGSPVTETYDSSSDPTTLANGTTQTFNSDGQLLTSKPSGGTTTSYNYNATGDRTSSGASSGSPAAISAVGNSMYNQGSGVTTDAVTAATTGDLMVLAVTTGSTAGVSSVSGGGVTTWHQGPNVQYGGGGADPDDEVWWGVITSTGASTITISPTPTGFSALTAHEFTAGSGVTWSLATSNTYESTNSPVDWPSLTATANEELYFGYAVAGYGNISAGSTSGFTYSQAPNQSTSMLAWDTSVSSTVQPTGTQNNTGGYDSTGAMFEATTGSGGASNTYGYNEADQMTSATASPNSVSYTYNGNGLLTGRTTSGATATLTWDDSLGLPLLLSDGTSEYLYGPDGTPIEQVKISTGTSDYFVSDDQGSTRALIGSSGSVVSTFSFDPDGNVVGTSGTVTTPLLYDGQYNDPVSGFYYLRARWYDAGTGEFATVDPDVAETDAPYAYAGDDPVNEGDPTGRDSKYGLTLGVCGSGAAEIGAVVGLGVQGVACALSSSSGNPGISGTIGVAALNAGAGVGVSADFLVSDAGNVKEMSGPFYAVEASVSINIPPLSVSGEVFWGINNGFTGIFGFEGGVGPGLGADAGIWLQNTWVHEFGGWACWLSPLCLAGKELTKHLVSSEGPSANAGRAILQSVWPIVTQHLNGKPASQAMASDLASDVVGVSGCSNSAPPGDLAVA